MLYRINTSFLIIFLFLTCSIYGQVSSVGFQNLNIEDGLSHSLVTGIVEDDKGFLWISTQNGLNRFDGYNFRQYYAGESNRTLQKNHIQDLYKDSFGQLWISYFRGGIDRFDPETGIFYSYRPDSSDKSSISSVEFSSTLSSDNFVRFFEDDENILWIASEKGINRFNRSTDNFTSYQFDGNKFFGLSDNTISSIVEDKYGYLWIGTYDGLNRLNKSTGTIERVITSSSNPELGAKPIISNLLPRKDGSLLVGTVNMGLFVIKNSNSEAPVHFTQYLNEFSSNKDEKSIYRILETSYGKVLLGTASGLYEFNESSNVINRIDAIGVSEVNNILEDNNGYIWVSRSTTSKNKNSLYRFDKDIKSYKVFGDKKTAYYSLNDVPISKIYSNSDGIIYLGTAKHGLYKININAKKFHLINSTSSDGLYITDNDVYSIYEDSNNYLWVGTSRALDRLDLNNNKAYSFNNDKLIKHNISYEYSSTLDAKLIGVIKETKDNKLWLGSFDYKISEYDPSKKLFLNFHHNPNDSSSFTGWSTRTICITKAGVTYFGGNDMGLCKLNADGKSFTHYKEFDENGINELTIYSLTEDKEGLIWMGTYKGLLKFNPNTENFTSYRDNENKSGYSITSILEPKVHERDDVLWLGTNVGLKKFNKNTKTFELFTKEDGIPDNTVLGILEDNGGNLWISTLNGLAKFNTITNEVISYSLQDGIQGKEFNEGAYFKNEKGIMYFGGTNGITYFNPEEIKVSSSHGKVIITGLKINQKYISVNDTVNGEVFLAKEIPYTDEINLTYDDRIVSIEFSSSNFESPNDTKYRYRLEGLEEEWNVVESNQRFANYSNLASGSYTLYIDNTNSDLKWSNNPTSLIITVSPPFWETTWFRFTVILIIFLLFLGYLIYHTNNINIQRKLLLIAVNERTAELKITNDELEVNNQKIIDLSGKLHELDQKKLQFFTNISHEFRTPLSLILSPTEKLIGLKNYKDTKLVKNNLKVIDRNSKRLFNLITQLLELPKAETGTLKLLVAQGDIVVYINEIFNLFEDYADTKNIKLSFNANVKNSQVYFDGDKIEKILYNLLSNAINYTPEGGTVDLVLSETLSSDSTPNICINVKDSGRGIPKEEIEFIFDRFYQIERKTTSKNISSGIGLSLVDSLVKVYGGSIKVDSEINKGTSFEVFLPTEKVSFETEEFRSAGEKETSYKYSKSMLSAFEDENNNAELSLDNQADGDTKEVVIIVEDNIDLNEFLFDELKDDYQVVTALNGEEGLELARKHTPSLILSDIAMPIMDGITLCKELKSDINTSHIPVFLLTAKTDEAQQMEGLSIGADDYIDKPFNLVNLKLRISNAIKARKELVAKFSTSQTPIPDGIVINELDHNLLSSIIEYVEKNIDTDITGDILSKELGLSKSNLYKKLKNLTGFSVNIYIRNIRLDVASKLLKNGKYSISEIAYAVGFNNPKYFSSCFMKHFGESPRSYMK